MSWESALFLGLILAAALYTLVPDFLLHYLGVGAWKRQYTPGVAITFDDGPNPEITPQILDILAQHHVTATFFVIGDKAARHPNLIKLIQDGGHQIGAHSQHHNFAWFMCPWKTWRDWEDNISTLEHLTGKVIEWIRPPWGTFNLSTWVWLKIRHKQAVLWNADGRDWRVQQSPEQINARILKQIKEGSIVLLHDGGGDEGAPQNTLRALDQLCRMIVEDKKLPLVELELPPWSGWRRLAFNLWGKWENIFARLYKVKRISSTNLFRLSKQHYHGPRLYSPTGQLLAQRGDLVVEMHLDSLRLYDNESGVNQTGVRLLRQVRESLSSLASYVAGHPDYDGIQVFVGLTLISQGLTRLGFQVQEMPATLFIRSVGLFQKLIMLVYRSSRMTSLKKYKGNQPKLVWISRQQLLEIYSPR
jgi:peptidoglycan/xylan/chitin deacetylase (PgdA/CDA1 family)